MKKFLNYLLANSDRYLPGLSGSLPKHYVGWKGRWMVEYLRVRYPVRTLHSIWNQCRINVYFLWIKILHQIQGNFVAIFKAVTLRMSAVSRTSLLAARACRAWRLRHDAVWSFEARTTLRMGEFDTVIADMILGTLLNNYHYSFCSSNFAHKSD